MAENKISSVEAFSKFKFGHGRPQGSKDKKKEKIRDFIYNFVSDQKQLTDFKRAVRALEPRDKVNAYLNLFEFVTPKLQRVESKQVNPTPIQLIFTPATPESLEETTNKRFIDITPLQDGKDTSDSDSD